MNFLARQAAKLLAIRSTWVVAALTFVWLSATTWTRPLFLPDEGRYVGVAWNMLSTHELLVPLLNGLPFFHKPPLFYWITALALQVFGVNEWAARFSSVACATLMVAMLFWFLKTHVNRQVAAIAAIILASSPFLFGAGQYANLDMTVAGMIAATVLLLASAVLRLERGQAYRTVLVLAYAAAGLGFLSKGLIGVVLPGGIVFFWLVGRKRFDTLRRLFWPPAIVAFLVVSLPWMAYMQWRYSGFFDYYIVYQHFQRFLESGFNNPHPFWFYVPVLIVLTLPWSVQLWRLASRRFWQDEQHADIKGLMLSWLLVVLIFFSIPSSKLVGYVLPALVPLAYFLALPFARRLNAKDAKAGTEPQRALRGFAVSLTVALAICVAAIVVLAVSPRPSTKGLAMKMSLAYTPKDSIVMLERIRYDLAFYLRSSKPAAIVADWNAPDIRTVDTWRKEVFDAAQFDPATAAPLLINSGELLARLCAAHDASVWLVGDRGSSEGYPFLAGLAPFAQDGKLSVWRIPAGTQPTFCAEKPRIDLK
ncbi:glycosyltransferase family 39 protein [Eoetvoesiella caeni]|uniref:Dolichyl-phosphate-mannose-protein mannosyltransferase n=1 Tax=Eoetvoesiella caeni TaxID=645616 RepID=A0A366HC46_9BURK|nr:glycosyltransferase family 39 protein [Eoetvoesiella caeni]MCI2809175.1 glycosyltransferase family 39 protein [Eoetvoesiella caeni]NYT54317.1 glycosyltransferase family 39 protein [Eoetvoesiella caeni]RBP39498.1 dolichyl-phosphate-mannose-protein mannosyltransferase [Eoetvoesiella caeni]